MHSYLHACFSSLYTCMCYAPATLFAGIRRARVVLEASVGRDMMPSAASAITRGVASVEKTRAIIRPGRCPRTGHGSGDGGPRDLFGRRHAEGIADLIRPGTARPRSSVRAVRNAADPQSRSAAAGSWSAESPRSRWRPDRAMPLRSLLAARRTTRGRGGENSDRSGPEPRLSPCLYGSGRESPPLVI